MAFRLVLFRCARTCVCVPSLRLEASALQSRSCSPLAFSFSFDYCRFQLQLLLAFSQVVLNVTACTPISATIQASRIAGVRKKSGLNFNRCCGNPGPSFTRRSRLAKPTTYMKAFWGRGAARGGARYTPSPRCCCRSKVL